MWDRNGGWMDGLLERGFCCAPSAAHATRRPRGVGGSFDELGAALAQARAACAGDAFTVTVRSRRRRVVRREAEPRAGVVFPLVGVLITEGTEDTLHQSYLASYVELDQWGGRTLLYQDIGNPNVKGPTVRQLIEGGVLSFDPSDVAIYEHAVLAAGGVVAYRRQEITRLRTHLRLSDEPTPFLVVVSTTRPDLYALLRIPQSALSQLDGASRLWKAAQTCLSETVLRGICQTASWSDEAMDGLQRHLDDVGEQLVQIGGAVAATSLIEGPQQWTITFGGISRSVPAGVGLGPLRRLLECPGVPIPAEDLWHERPGASLPGSDQERADAAADLTVGLLSGVEIADDRALSELRREHDRKVEESTRAEEAGDLDRAQRLDHEAAEIEKEMGRLTGLGGRRRTMDDHQRRQIDTVQRRVRRAMQAINHVHPLAGLHLKSSISVRRDLCYRPDPPVTWST